MMELNLTVLCTFMLPTGTIASSYSIWISINTAVWANCPANSNLQHQLTVLLICCNRPVIVMMSSRYWTVERYFVCVVQSVLCVASDWTVRGSNSGRSKRSFSCAQRPDKLYGPPRLLFIGHRMVFTSGKDDGTCVDHSKTIQFLRLQIIRTSNSL